MRLVEIIHFRIDTAAGEEILRELSRRNSEENVMEMYIYRNPAVATDFSIHLVWQNELLKQSGSPEGQRLAACLKDLCQVRYTVWQEIPFLKEE